MTLSNRQLRHLRGLTHKLQPVVMVADKGLTDTVWTEIETALDHHELVKIKLKSDRDTRKTWIEEISTNCKAEVVHSIGQVASFFRRNPEKQVVDLPS